ncbi:unnamed protein product, partial [Oncorhynchus mykiss]
VPNADVKIQRQSVGHLCKHSTGPRALLFFLSRTEDLLDVLSRGINLCTLIPYRSILQQLLVSIAFPNFLHAADTDDEIPDMSKESCITEQTQYFYDNEEKSFRGTLDCENCSR